MLFAAMDVSGWNTPPPGIMLGEEIRHRDRSMKVLVNGLVTASLALQHDMIDILPDGVALT